MRHVFVSHCVQTVWIADMSLNPSQVESSGNLFTNFGSCVSAIKTALLPDKYANEEIQAKERYAELICGCKKR